MSDVAPYVVLGLMLAILPLVFILGLARLLKHRKALRAGWQALDEGRLADANLVFKGAASRNLDFFVGLGKEPFAQALEGLAIVYQTAGLTVDLDPVRQIRRAIQALEKGKVGHIGEKFTSGGKLGEAVRGLKTGWKVETLVQEGRTLIAALPDLSEAKSSHRGPTP
jgi:hypothetical protein